MLVGEWGFYFNLGRHTMTLNSTCTQIACPILSTTGLIACQLSPSSISFTLKSGSKIFLSLIPLGFLWSNQHYIPSIRGSVGYRYLCFSTGWRQDIKFELAVIKYSWNNKMRVGILIVSKTFSFYNNNSEKLFHTHKRNTLTIRIVTVTYTQVH